MARGGKKEKNAAAAPPNPEAEERKRLKRLAFKNKMLSETPASLGPSAALSPSKTVLKHHGKDILRKSQRKNRFLFSFPGLLGPVSGGKIGELKNLGTKNPILYLDFPQGQMKLFGTIVYPKNRYLTLQFSRGGKNVMCEDYFDNVIVFSEAWWIGKKDENPEEVRLELPKELSASQGQNAECDFKGGAGAVCDENKGVSRSRMKCTEQQSPKHELEDDLSDSPRYSNGVTEVTPIRHSARTAGKSFKFAEASSGDDFIDNGTDMSEGEKETVDVKHPIRTRTSTKTESSRSIVFDIDKEHDSESTPFSEQIKQSAKSTSKGKDVSHSNQGSLVQATISTLFKKVEDKVGGPKKKGRTIEGKKVGTETMTHEGKTENLTSASSVKVYQRKTKSVVSPESGTSKRQASKRSTSDLVDPVGSSELEVDDIEEFSSSSKDMDASDEDWGA